MQDDGVVFLTCSRQESRHVDEAYDGDVEGIAEAHKACTLAASINVEHACIAGGLIGYDAHALSVETGKTDDDIAGKLWLYLKELAVVNNGTNHLIHVVGFVGIVGQYLVEAVFHAVDGVGALFARCLLHVVGGYVAQQRTYHLQGFFFSLCAEVCHTALRCVYRCAAKVFLVDVFTCDALYHLRSGEEHVGGSFHHECKVGECG